jgi:two-component system invasion response regulator UvrY
MNRETIRVLLADDHAVVRAGFRRLLETAEGIAVVAEAESGVSVLEHCSDLRIDVAVVDLSMPGMTGLELIPHLRRVAAETQILVLSVHESEPFPSTALRRGAAGYLSKRCAPEELITAIRQVARGERFIGRDVATELALDRVNGQQTDLEGLTPREFQVFALLARGVSVNDIAKKIFLSPKTVHVYRRNVLHKLNAKSTADLVRIAIRNGVVEA